MNREEIYNVWAPPGAAWSPWVKPVLFAHARPLSYYTQFALPAAPAATWLGRADGTSALVLDLPDALGVSLALVAAQQELAQLIAELRFETGTLVQDPSAPVTPQGLTTVPR